MPVIVQTVTSKVSAIWGRAQIRDAQGKMQPLKLGQVVVRGDVILTDQDSIVQLSLAPELDALPALAAAPAPAPAPVVPDTADMDKVIAGIERGDADVAPTAGTADGGLMPAERVSRVDEQSRLSANLVSSSGLPAAGGGLNGPVSHGLQAATSTGSTTGGGGTGAPAVKHVTPELGVSGQGSTAEGSALVYTVGLSTPTTEATTYPFALGGGTANAADVGTPLFSNGVVLNPDGTITVPAGVSSFTVSVPTLQDTVHEGPETLPVTIGGTTGTGTITDDDQPPTVDKVQAGHPGVGDAAVTEGTALVYNVTLSNASSNATTHSFVLGGGTADGTDHGAPTFSNGVVLNGDGTISVPAGVTAFTVSVPTTADGVDEPNETLELTVGGAKGTGIIIDNDGAPNVASIEPGEPGIGDDAVNEGTALVYTVNFNGLSSTPQTYSFALGSGSAAADDFGTPIFSHGVVLNDDGSITVPAGVASFTVTVPTLNDSLDEPNETVPLTIGGITGLGTIVDDDGVPNIGSVEPGQPGVDDDAVTEGTALLFNVSLTHASSTVSVHSFSLGGGTVTPDDIGAPVFSNGVVLNDDGTITVPAGVTAFTVSVPTAADTVDEPNESVLLSIGGVSGIGTILDDDGAPTVDTVEPGRPGVADDSTPEGAPLTYEVSLSNASATPVVYAFTLGGGTAGADDVGTPVFSNGVVMNPDGTITVPAGVSSFTVTVPTVQDSVHEGDESLPFSVGGVSGQGTIVDDDGGPKVTGIEPGQPGVGDDAVVEGTALVWQVALSNASATASTLPFQLGGGTASADDFGIPVFSDGVVLNADGTITVPAGVASFSVTVPTTADSTDESDEGVPLTIGGVTGLGTITDDDGPPTIGRIEPGLPGPGDDSAPEGDALAYTVTLSNPSDKPTTFDFSLGGGTTNADDVGTPVFSDGVVWNPDGTITVPAGVTSFTVSIPTTQDTLDEPNETLPLTIGGVSATATIVDDDGTPNIGSVEPGVPGVGDDAVVEGTSLTYNVSLTNASAMPTQFAFTLGGGTAAAGDFGAPVFSDGVVLNADGTITVPAGVTTFTVTVPTTPDNVDEADEGVPLTIGGITGLGTISDDDGPPTIKTIEPGQLVPGGDSVGEGAALVYNVGLSSPSASPTTYAFQLGGGTAATGDFGAPAFSNGVVLNADGTITVPAGVTAFTVSLPTTQDSIEEGRRGRAADHRRHDRQRHHRRRR